MARFLITTRWAVLCCIGCFWTICALDHDILRGKPQLIRGSTPYIKTAISYRFGRNNSWQYQVGWDCGRMSITSLQRRAAVLILGHKTKKNMDL